MYIHTHNIMHKFYINKLVALFPKNTIQYYISGFRVIFPITIIGTFYSQYHKIRRTNNKIIIKRFTGGLINELIDATIFSCLWPIGVPVYFLYGLYFWIDKK